MIIFILAEDSFRGIQRKKELINQFLAKNPKISINNFNLENESVDDFLNFLKNQSIFEDKKFAILYNLFGALNNNLVSELKNILNDKKNIVLIYDSKKPPKELSFILKKPAFFERIEILKDKKWLNFALSEIKKRKMLISKDALNVILKLYEGDSFKLITELDKLSLLNRSINLNDLNIDEQPNFWNVLSLFKNINIKNRLWALEKILNSKEPLPKVFYSLPYVCRERINDLAVYDRAVKSYKLDYEEALLDFVL
jgi:DNA polymerase III delta subunit